VLSCVISDDGSHIAYVAAVDDYIGDLYLYDVSAQSPVKLASNVLAADNYICISPDGKSVGYIGDYEFFMDSYVNVPSDEFIGYVYVDGEIMELGEQCYPVALSNNADFLYYFEVNDAGTDLYVKYGGTKEKLSSDELILFFNQDMSELLFDGEVVCLWSPDSGVVDISDDYTTMLSSSRYSYSKRACVDFTLMFTLPLSTFKNEMAWTSDGSDGILYVIGSEYEMIKIAEGNNPYISGSKIIYTDAYGNCYRMDDIKKDAEGRLIFENADEVYAASSLEDIYCQKGGGLYHVTLSGEANLITDGISAAALSPHDLLYFLTGEGELFCVDGDAAPVRIAEQASGLDSYENGVYYTVDTDEGLDVYINTSGDTFVKILSGVDSLERVTVFGFEYIN
jgi:sugar lactone lactonase YvrE